MALFGSWLLGYWFIDTDEQSWWDIGYGVVTLAIAAYWFTQQPPCAPAQKFMEEVGVVVACQAFIKNLVCWAAVGWFAVATCQWLAVLGPEGAPLNQAGANAGTAYATAFAAAFNTNYSWALFGGMVLMALATFASGFMFDSRDHRKTVFQLFSLKAVVTLVFVILNIFLYASSWWTVTTLLLITSWGCGSVIFGAS